MKHKGLLIVLIVLVLLAIIGVSAYNGLAAARESVDTAEAQIDAMLQRRADLIPNVVATVQSFTDHETDVINAVTEARKQLAGAKTVEEKAAADDALTTALSGLTVVVENYPELKSDTVYVGLMDELEGSENRIAVARQDYNTAVQRYNQAIVRFPKNLLARLFGFEKAPYFAAAAGAETVPDVAGLLAG